MRVFLTGGRGLLGSVTAVELMRRGHEVTLFQRGVSHLDVRQVQGDVRERDAVQAAVRGHDAVIHMAARVSTVGSWADFFAVNVDGTHHVLEAARTHGVERFVYISSPSVAHRGDALVGAEATPADPERARSSYSRSKALAEVEVLAAADIATVALRPHLVWGPGDTQLIARIVERARTGRLVLLDGGRVLIDTTVVDNAATAIAAGLERVTTPAVRGHAFVVSNGEPRTVRELFTRICAAAGVPAPRRTLPSGVAMVAGSVIERMWGLLGRSDEPPMTRFLAEQLSTAHWFAQRQTRAALAWEPAVDLETGFASLQSWFTSGVATSHTA